MPYPVRVLACVSALFASTALAAAGARPLERRPPQYVIISFDSAQHIAQWERSRALAEKTGARFTYFLSCVYLLSKDRKQLYHPPGKGAGRSNIGFAESTRDVAERLGQVTAALSEGHEIGSHGCGHFDGKDWSKAEWLAEFSAFSAIFRDAWRINGLEGEPPGWRENAGRLVKGFRAPYLATGRAMFEALAQAGFAYDASGISRQPAGPSPAGGLERFALPQIPEGPQARKVIAMDYNLFVRHSGGFERPDEAAAFQARTYDAFKAAFDRQYEGERAPLQLGFHFTLMNDGAYWNALEAFAGEVCVKADVVCTSYADYLSRTAASRAGARPASAGG